MMWPDVVWLQCLSCCAPKGLQSAFCGFMLWHFSQYAQNSSFYLVCFFGGGGFRVVMNTHNLAFWEYIFPLQGVSTWLSYVRANYERFPSSEPLVWPHKRPPHWDYLVICSPNFYEVAFPCVFLLNFVSFFFMLYVVTIFLGGGSKAYLVKTPRAQKPRLVSFALWQNVTDKE